MDPGIESQYHSVDGPARNNPHGTVAHFVEQTREQEHEDDACGKLINIRPAKAHNDHLICRVTAFRESFHPEDVTFLNKGFVFGSEPPSIQ